MTSVLRELMLGKRPIRRTNPKSGQSEWYYMGPNGIEIDVENENSPNPYEAAIKNYWAQNDDYNYKLVYGNTPPPSSAQTQTIDATSTLPNDSATLPTNKGIITVENITSSPIEQSIQCYLDSLIPKYTLPNLLEQSTIEANDSSYPKNQRTTYNQFIQSDAYNKLRDFHILHEGYKRTIDNGGKVFPYPDINGDITGCIGHNMVNDFNKHPWLSAKTGQSLGSSQISSEEKNLQNIQNNLKPELYAAKTDARLPQKYCDNLYDQDIEYRWQTLNKVIPNWQQMSPEMQAATMDVHYTGNMAPKNKWTMAKGAAQNMEQDDYCDNLHRDDTNRRDIAARNKWVRDMCLSGKFYK